MTRTLTLAPTFAGSGPDTAAALIIREAGDAERSRWQRFVERHPSATFFHQWSSRTVVEERFGPSTVMRRSWRGIGVLITLSSAI
jgi:hypothetical protein